MSEYTIISASNRADNKTRVFAGYCLKILEDQGLSARLFNLEDFLPILVNIDMYDFENSPTNSIVEKYLKGVDKLLFIIPEYNGSFPGILKLFIDSIHPGRFRGKKAALIGISSGHAGNARGMDHLTSVLHYIKVDVFYHKLSISMIEDTLDQKGVSDRATQRRILRMIQEFRNY